MISGGSSSCWPSCSQWQPLISPLFYGADSWSHSQWCFRYSCPGNSNWEATCWKWNDYYSCPANLIQLWEGVESFWNMHGLSLASGFNCCILDLDINGDIDFEALHKEMEQHDTAFISYNHHWWHELNVHHHGYLYRVQTELLVIPSVYLAIFKSFVISYPLMLWLVSQERCAFSFPMEDAILMFLLSERGMRMIQFV